LFGSTSGRVDVILDLSVVDLDVVDAMTQLLTLGLDEIVDVLSIMVVM